MLLRNSYKDVAFINIQRKYFYKSIKVKESQILEILIVFWEIVSSKEMDGPHCIRWETEFEVTFRRKNSRGNQLAQLYANLAVDTFENWEILKFQIY